MIRAVDAAAQDVLCEVFGIPLHIRTLGCANIVLVELVQDLPIGHAGGLGADIITWPFILVLSTRNGQRCKGQVTSMFHASPAPLTGFVHDAIFVFCTNFIYQVAVDKGIAQAAKDFDTASICAVTGLTVRSGLKYEITVIMATPWEEGGRAVNPNRLSDVDD